jgi:phosphatidylinositol-3-phosphatase
MHDGSIQRGDTWLSHELPKIMATDAYKNGGVIFLLWDEGSSGTLGGAADDPPFIVISPTVKPGYVSTVDYDTSSYLRTVQQILGIDPVPCAKDREAVRAMDDLFAESLTP